MKHNITSNRRQFLGMTGALALTLAGSASNLTRKTAAAAQSSDDSVLTVAASTMIWADIVQNVGGDRLDVFSVVPTNADPHVWEAMPQDIIRATEADTFIWMGAYAERFVEAGGWRRALDDANIPDLELAANLDLIVRDIVIDHGDHVHDLREGDPHIWLDPLMTVEAVGVITDHLSALDPAGVDQYAANAAAYSVALQSVHDEYERELAVIPPERRKLVVFHDAFAYFAARYDFEVVGVVLRNPEGDPSAGDVADLIEIIERETVSAVFKEPQYNAQVLEMVAAETGVVVGELITDSFADRVHSYTELLEFNLESLVVHLGAE